MTSSLAEEKPSQAIKVGNQSLTCVEVQETSWRQVVADHSDGVDF
jgi:hypothetical protein